MDRVRARSEVVDRGYTTPCHVFTGPLHNGYGYIGIGQKTKFVHRVTWEAANGPVPDGLELDHLCRQRDCWEPTHLEPVTRRENILRGDGPRLTRERGFAQTHCKNGHPLSGENLSWWTHRGGSLRRICKTCRRDYARRYYWQKRDAA